MAENPELVTVHVAKHPNLIPSEIVRDARLDPLISVATKCHEALLQAESDLEEARMNLDRIRTIIRRSPVPSG